MDRFLNTKLKETETGEQKALQVEISLSKVLRALGSMSFGACPHNETIHSTLH